MSDSRPSTSETPQEHLIQLAPFAHPVHPSQPLSPLTHTPHTPPPVTTTVPEGYTSQDPPTSITLPRSNTMPESVYSYYSESDADSLYADAQSDVESICEAQCQKAQAVRLLQPGRPSVVDLMRVDKPVFKRASQMVVRRPVERPFISPIQPPKNYRRSFSPGHGSSGSESESSKQSSSGSSSEPSTPILDDEDGATTPTSEASPSTPDTPKSSFEQEHNLSYKENLESHSSSFKSKMSSRLRMFPKRSTSMGVYAGIETQKHAPQLPPLFADRARSSTTNLATTNLQDASYHLSSSPEKEAFVPRHIPQRSIWRDAGKSKFLNHKLRRVDSRIGLNAH
ncbi:hypothetical protein CAC42_183 [Sphaceloma murrayae]|uniref:Uncharacterized protein n=1 Tax=Sphaceloma murrayae TaxID=2082308 RepID=A0A2K1QNF5_9PEZI|nr:hypothetical protein CAC42_183 [Sphaceloma murrayae]